MRDRGFTLIELVIVLVLISLSIALVTPSLGRISGSLELKSTAKKISALLRHSRSEAIQKGNVQQVLFDRDLREIRIQGTESPEEQKGKEEQRTKTGPQKYRLPGGIQIKEVTTGSPQYSADFPTVEFYPNGASNGAAITLDRENHRALRITVHFLTGLVAVEDA